MVIVRNGIRLDAIISSAIGLLVHENDVHLHNMNAFEMKRNGNSPSSPVSMSNPKKAAIFLNVAFRALYVCIIRLANGCIQEMFIIISLL